MCFAAVFFSLLETVRIKRVGFAFRQSYEAFLARYKMLSLHTWPGWCGLAAEGVTYLLRDLPISMTEYAFGRTKLFIRTPETVRRSDGSHRSCAGISWNLV